MTEVHETNHITIAQNFVLAQTPEELQEAMGAIYCDCLARPVGMSRETAQVSVVGHQCESHGSSA